MIFIIIITGSFFIQIFYYIFFYTRIFQKDKNEKDYKKFPVSVIISAKNEAENLKKFLPKIINQNYYEYEIIIINDCSNDNSSEILKDFSQRYKNLHFIDKKKHSDFPCGKKYALTEGIKIAKYEHLLFTDADCFPVSENWISSVAKAYNSETEIVSAYGAYINRKGFLNKIIRFDTLFIAMQYMSYTKAGISYMATGRNISYKKTLFEKQKGFRSHYHILSGDDDLFVNKAATSKNTKIVTSPESFTYSVPKSTYRQYIKQKQRHLTTGKYYKINHKLLLGGEIGSRFLFYLFLLLSLLLKINYLFAVVLFFIRLLIQIIIFGKAVKLFNEKGIIFLVPLLDILLPAISLKIIFLNIFTKKTKQKTWK